MNRKVLLLEPSYKNKYPPIGLMKLATYHRDLGDKVTFFKGDIKNFSKDKQNFYDRICVSTLFTFYWKKTIETIQYAQKLLNKDGELWVGGITASIHKEEIENILNANLFSKINIHFGLLDKPNILDKNDTIIDNLPLDYSILEEIEYKYPVSDAYFAYTTRGCSNKCKFCAVPIIEPTFKHYIPLKDNFEYIKNTFGEPKDLILLDNNVLNSENFEKIIQEIKEIGFYKGAKYVEPNWLEIYFNNLNKKNCNEKFYVRKIVEHIHLLLKKLKETDSTKLNSFLQTHNLENSNVKIENFSETKEILLKLLSEFPQIIEWYAKFLKKHGKNRYVDFNQGIDARLLDEKKAKLLSEIAIRPVRIAFDNIKFRKHYEKAIRLCVKFGILDFSNYILYNFTDKPEDFYHRIKINTDLREELGLKIFSFPMKYLEIEGNKSRKRDNYGKYWNKKFIRAIYSILNATYGKIGHRRAFVEKAFGKNLEEFIELLYMPNDYLVYRFFYEKIGYTQKWKQDFEYLKSLDKYTEKKVKKIIEKMEFNKISLFSDDSKIVELLEHYTVFLANDIELQKKYDEWNQTKNTNFAKIRKSNCIH